MVERTNETNYAAECGKEITVKTQQNKTKTRNPMPPGAGRSEKTQVRHFRTTEIRGGRGQETSPRPTSKRGQLYELLTSNAKGMTLEAIMKKFSWKARDAMDALRILGKTNHCHLRYDDNTATWKLVKK